MNKITDENQLESLSALIDNHWYDNDEVAGNVLAGLQGHSQSNQQLREKYERYHLIRDVMQKEQSAIDMSGFADSVSAAIAKEPAIVSPAGVQRNRQARVIGDINGDSIPETRTLATDDRGANVQSLDSARQQKSERSAQKAGGFWSGRVGTGVGGVAVAASAAMVALLGYNLLEQQGSVQQGQQQVAEAPSLINPADSGSVALNANTALAQSTNVQSVLPAVSDSNQPVLEQFQNSGAGNNIQFVSNTSTYWVKDGKVNEPRNVALEKRLNMLLGHHIESSPTAGLSGMLPYSRLAGYDIPTPAAEPGVEVENAPAGQ